MATTYQGGVCPQCLKTYDRQTAALLRWVCPCGESMFPTVMPPVEFRAWLRRGCDSDEEKGGES